MTDLEEMLIDRLREIYALSHDDKCLPDDRSVRRQIMELAKASVDEANEILDCEES